MAHCLCASAVPNTIGLRRLAKQAGVTVQKEVSNETEGRIDLLVEDNPPPQILDISIVCPNIGPAHQIPKSLDNASKQVQHKRAKWLPRCSDRNNKERMSASTRNLPEHVAQARAVEIPVAHCQLEEHGTSCSAICCEKLNCSIRLCKSRINHPQSFISGTPLVLKTGKSQVLLQILLSNKLILFVYYFALMQVEELVTRCIKADIRVGLVLTKMYNGSNAGSQDAFQKLRTIAAKNFGGLYETKRGGVGNEETLLRYSKGVCIQVNSVQFDGPFVTMPQFNVSELVLALGAMLDAEQLVGLLNIILNNRSFWQKCGHSMQDLIMQKIPNALQDMAPMSSVYAETFGVERGYILAGPSTQREVDPEGRSAQNGRGEFR
ncbi:hypothetical protein Pelo_813 [Pelomyxa schiedti]|nr:hypothetical protein Pelo_813 [Pelomyxa schiedti]